MKKLFAILAVMGVLTLGSVQPIMAQDEAPLNLRMDLIIGRLRQALKKDSIHWVRMECLSLRMPILTIR